MYTYKRKSRNQIPASHIEYSPEDFDKDGVDFKVKVRITSILVFSLRYRI